jgi:hypothetical protein
MDEEPSRLDRIVAMLSTRAAGLGVVVALAVALIVLMVAPFPSRSAEGRDRPRPTRNSIPPQPASPRPEVLPAAWLPRVTFITDSVGLGAVDTLREKQPGWIVRVRGHAALMIHDALSGLRAEPIKIEHVVVVALGYNSLWQHQRRDYGHWADYFDLQVNALLGYLRNHGARKIVWVTLRTPSRSAVPAPAMWQYNAYAWYFPYVDEQLHILDRHNPDLVLADWAGMSNRPGLTYDAIHLNPTGAALYAHMIWNAVLHTPFGPGT